MAAIGVGAMAFHQLFESGLDVGAGRAVFQAQRVKRQKSQPAGRTPSATINRPTAAIHIRKRPRGSRQ
jgi:hypothetical protein